MNNNLRVLDVCCGSKSFWFDREDNRAMFVDIRKEKVQADKRIGRNPINISPDLLSDFQYLPFADSSFSLVVFDPPHARFGKTSYMAMYYGRLDDNWREVIRKGFSECFRVLRPDGVLIFKWNETDYKVKDILKLTSEKPLFGHKSGKLLKTHWLTFIKSGQ